MEYDVKTIDELIDLFGGPAALADLLGLGAPAICNWSSRNFIPPSWHVRLLYELRLIGKTVDPSVFECTPEQFAVLFPTMTGATAHVAA